MKIKHLINEDSIVDAGTVINLVASIHGRSEDVEDGDLNHRLSKFDTYEKKVIDINDVDLDEWEVDEDFVEELKTKIEKGGYEPIVFDPDEGSIIDGTHRANALHQLGYTKIKAYVGKDIDPYWGDE